MKLNEKQFRTSDINLASVLCCNGYFLADLEKERSGKAIFIFETNKELEIIVSKFWSRDLQVEPLAFSNWIKQLKSRIFDS